MKKEDPKNPITKMVAANPIQSVSPSDTSITYDFQDYGNVDQWLVGISYFYYNFGDEDHEIQTISASLGTDTNGTEVTIKADMTMKDDGTNRLYSDSHIDVACIAAIGEGTISNVQFSSGLDFKSGEDSDIIGLSNSTYSNQAVLSGFDLSFGEQDHHVFELAASISTGDAVQGESIRLRGEAIMRDSSGHSASSASLEGAFLGTYEATTKAGSGSGLLIKTKTYSNDDPRDTVSFDFELTGVAVFIKSFSLSYDKEDHHVEDIKVGATDVMVNPENKKEVFLTPWARMIDDSDHVGEGEVQLLIVGTTEIKSEDQSND